MPSNSTTASPTTAPTITSTTTDGVSHIDLGFASAMTRGSGSIFVTDGVVQTVIDRVTGLTRLRVVGATVTKEIPLDQLHFSGDHVMFDVAGLPAGASFNVFMAAGTLLSGGRAWAGLSAPGQAAFATPEVVVTPPPPPPTVSATIELDGNSLKSGEDIFVTITFSKVVAVLDPAALSAANATLSSLATYDEGKTWVARLTGNAATDAPAGTLRLDMSKVVAADGSQGLGVVESSSYLVDTLVAAYVGSSIDLVADAGPDRYDGVSNDDAMEVSGLLYGSLKAGETFELRINGVTIDAASITIVPTYSSGVMRWSYDGGASRHFNADENTVQARIVGADGHSSPPAAKTVVIDTDSPDIVAAPGAPVDLSGPIQISFNEKMYWDDNVEVTRDVKVVDGFGNTSWIDLSEGQLSLDRKTLSFNPADHDLATGNSYRLYLPEGLTDLAGNAYAGPVVEFTTAGPFQDKAPPRLLQAYIANGNGLYGKGDVLEFRLRYSEKVVLDAGTTPRLDLVNNATATYTGLSADGTEMIFSYTVAAGEDTSSLNLYTPWSLAGHVRDLAGNVMQNVHIEFDDLSTADGYGAMVEIDTVVGTPGKPQLHASSDTGTAGDFITIDTTPRLSGSGVDAGATVSLYAGDLLVGSATANADGNWDTELSSALGAGTHSITVRQQDLAGNISERSAGLTVIVMALPAASGAPGLQAASDTGTSSSDGITADNTPTIAGSGAAANSTLTLTHNGAGAGSVLVTADASGNWSYTPATLDDGLHSYTVRYPDVAGHASPESAALSLTVDTNKPNLISSPHGATAFATSADLVIGFDEAVRWHGSEGEDDLLVLQTADGNRRTIAIDNANLSSDGKTLTLRAVNLELLASTNYRVILPQTLTDLAGNRLDEYEIVFDTAAPAPPPAYDGPTAVRAFVNAGDHAVRAGETLNFRLRFDEDVKLADDAILSIGLSNDKRAELTGIDGRELLFRYVVASGDDTEGLAIADTSLLAGHIADLAGNLLDGAHIAFDGLYESSGYGSYGTWLDIDTIVPDMPGTPELDHDSDSGIDDDLLTRYDTPVLEGEDAEAGARIELYEGDTLLGSTYADDEGEWELGVDAGHALADGVHSLHVRQVDAAGNRSAASAALTVTVDTAAAAPSSPRLANAHDTGASATDGLTNIARPDFTGTGAEAGATIRILAGDTVVGTGRALPDGSWTASLAVSLEDGSYTYRAQQVDAAGNMSTVSAPLSFTVDRSAPAAPARPSLAAASDSGASDSDGITNITTPTFTGSGAQAGATLVLMAGTSEIGRTVVDEAGNWTVTVSAAKALANASYAITAFQVDQAGNAGTASSALSLVIDTVGPSVTGSGPNPLVAREFQLKFNEEIVFHPSGRFDLKASAANLANFTGSSGNWYRSDGAGGEDSVLNFKIGPTGLLKLQMNNGAIQDVAGNAAVIGVPEWDIDFTGLSA